MPASAGNVTQHDVWIDPVSLEALAGCTEQDFMSYGGSSGWVDPSRWSPQVQTSTSPKLTSNSWPWLSSNLDTFADSERDVSASVRNPSSNMPGTSEHVLVSRSLVQQMQSMAHRLAHLEQAVNMGQQGPPSQVQAHTLAPQHAHVVAPIPIYPAAVANPPPLVVAFEGRVSQLESEVRSYREERHTDLLHVRDALQNLGDRVLRHSGGWSAGMGRMAEERRSDFRALNLTLQQMTAAIGSVAEKCNGLRDTTNSASKRLRRIEDTLGVVDEETGEKTLKERIHSLECMLMELLEKAEAPRTPAACLPVICQETVARVEAVVQTEPSAHRAVGGGAYIAVNHEPTAEEYSSMRLLHEPARCRKWMEAMFVPAPGSSISQMAFTELYRAAFSSSIETQLAGRDLIFEVIKVFPGIQGPTYANGEFLIQGISRRQGLVTRSSQVVLDARKPVEAETQTEGMLVASVSYSDASISTTSMYGAADVGTQVELSMPTLHIDAQTETEVDGLAVMTAPEQLSMEDILNTTTLMQEDALEEGPNPPQPHRIRLEHNSLTASSVPDRDVATAATAESTFSVQSTSIHPCGDVQAEQDEVATASSSLASTSDEGDPRAPTPSVVDSLEETATRNSSEGPVHFEKELSELSELTPSRESTIGFPDGLDGTAQSQQHNVQSMLELYHAIPVGHTSDEEEGTTTARGRTREEMEGADNTGNAAGSSLNWRPDQDDQLDIYDIPSRNITPVPGRLDIPQEDTPLQTQAPLSQELAFVPYPTEQLQKVLSDALLYAANKATCSSSTSLETEITAATSSRLTEKLPIVTYTDRQDFCYCCARNDKVDSCIFDVRTRNCVRCRQGKFECYLYRHQPEADKVKRREKLDVQLPTSSSSGPKTNRSKSESAKAQTCKMEPGSSSGFLTGDAVIWPQGMTSELPSHKPSAPVSPSYSMSSLTSLSDAGDAVPSSDTGLESEEETARYNLTTYAGSRRASVHWASSPTIFEFEPESESISNVKRKRKNAGKAVYLEELKAKRRKLVDKKASSASVPFADLPKSKRGRPKKTKASPSRSPLCWEVMHGYNGHCSWPEVIEEGKLVTDFVQCSSCEAWYHFGCVGIADENDPRLQPDAEFDCPPCKSSKAKHGIGRKLRNIPDDLCARPGCTLYNDLFFIEKIIGRSPRETAQGVDFMWLFKWLRYDIEDATWETSEKLPVNGANYIAAFEQTARSQNLPVDDPQSFIVLEEAAYFWKPGWAQPF